MRRIEESCWDDLGAAERGAMTMKLFNSISEVTLKPVLSAEATGSVVNMTRSLRPSDYYAARGSPTKVKDVADDEAKIDEGPGPTADESIEHAGSDDENVDDQARVDSDSTALSGQHAGGGEEVPGPEETADSDVKIVADEVDNSRSNATSTTGSFGKSAGEQARVDSGSALSRCAEQEPEQTADCADKIEASDAGISQQSSGGSKHSKLEEKADQACAVVEEGPQKQQQIKRKDSNASSYKRKTSSSSQNSLQTITINAEDLKQISNPVDNWVHRIRHNDDYLQRGLDFSRPVDGGGNNGQTRVRIGNVGAQRLAAALAHNTHLLSLNLSDCNICYTGGVALARCLYIPHRDGEGESRTSLRHLNVSNNRVGDVGAMEFGTALRHNRSLRELDMSSNEVHFEGASSLLGGLSENRRLRRLVARDIQQTLSSDEMSKLVDGIGAAVRNGSSGGGESLEVLEMHSTADDDGSRRPDNFEGMGEGQAESLVDLATGPNGRVANVRIRRITLPRTSAEQPTCDGEGVQKLRRILRFNAFIQPILQLHDIVDSPLAKAEVSLRLKVKIPDQLRRDRRSGALLALLPSSSTRPESNSGVEYKLMPPVMSIAGQLYELEVLWNVVRYRPDVFCCAGSSMVVAPCGSCLPFGDGFCSIS